MLFFQSNQGENEFAPTYQVWIGFEDVSYMGFVSILVKMKLHRRADKSFLCVRSGSLCNQDALDTLAEEISTS